MLPHLPLRPLVIGHLHLVAAQGHDRAAGLHGRGDHRPALWRVLQRNRTFRRGRGGCGLLAGPALAAAGWLRAGPPRLSDLARSRAAATRPANSGWARVGRDRNSGCAWVATKNV